MDKIALVTGGASGIGKNIALKMASEGIDCVIFDIKEGSEVVKEIEDRGVRGIYKKVDISNMSEVNSTLKEISKQIGNVNILVNNAGITRDTLLIRMNEEDWDSVIKVNLKGTFNCTKSVLRGMMKQRWGRIVSISSVIGIMGNAGQSNYAASKAGILGFTRSIAREVASRNITVNAVAPGFIMTEMTDSLPDEVKDEYLDGIPMGRFGTVEDVANLVGFLVSEEAGYITGQVVQVNGGLLTQ